MPLFTDVEAIQNHSETVVTTQPQRLCESGPSCSQSLALTSGICYPRVGMSWFIGPAHHYSSFFLPCPCPERSLLYLEKSQ